MCISWTIKGLISLMHGITMKIKEHVLQDAEVMCVLMDLHIIGF